MDKRTFLKTSAAVVAGGLLSPLAACRSEEMAAPRTNWAGNLTYSAETLHLPGSVEEAREIVRNSSTVRPLGSRHCFNTIADSPVSQISLGRMNGVVELDEASNQVTVESGILYGDLSTYLHERGYAVHNLASLPHISVAGAIATATHGSGVANGNLATPVSAIEFIDARGDLHTLTRDDDAFSGAAVHLGGLGVITRITLDVEPTFDVVQHVYLDLPRAALGDHFDEIMSSGYSVSLFTDYQSDTVNQVWVKRRADEAAGDDEPAEADFFGARPATRNVHPIIEISAENCTEQMGVPGPWHERLPHFRMWFTPSSGTELQAEYFIPREAASEALQLLYEMGDRLDPILMISEVRTIAADDLWMSTAYGRDSVAVHFTCEQDWEALQQILPVIEEALAPYEPRPHWGKMFTLPRTQLQSRYERLADYRELVRQYDPDGKFRNAFLEETVWS
ncbi:MAG: D-arabinono-1,4-lactone oxidase [Rhodothermales bacterium]